jgi:transcriptional regulator with XRE-family HTH domain
LAGAVATRLDSINAKAGIRNREVAEMVGATPQTISRWRQGHVEPHPTHLKRLLTLEWLTSELAEFYDRDEARLWIFTPHRLLRGETPARRIQDGRIDDVLELIEQLKTGAYV